jgi:gliding motility-associated-like protein
MLKKYSLLILSFLIIFNTYSQIKFNPKIECYVNDEDNDSFNSSEQDSLVLLACFHTKNNKFYKDSITLKVDTNTFPNGYLLSDLEIEWTIHGVGFRQGLSMVFKPIEPGGYLINLFIRTKDGKYSGKNSCKLKFSAVPQFKAFRSFPDSLCMDKSVIIPYKTGDGTKIDDPITLDRKTFSMGGLQKVETPLPDAPQGETVSYESIIEIDDFGTNSKITSSKDINQMCISMEHSYLGDLEMTLICPSGKEITIFNSYKGDNGSIPGGFGGGYSLGNDLEMDGGPQGSPQWQYCFSSKKSNFGTFADEIIIENFKLNIVNNLAMNPDGIYLPEESFDKFIGCPVKGEWKIKVKDNSPGDDGYIFNWGIMFNGESFPFLESYQNKIVSQSWVKNNSIKIEDSVLNITPKILGNNLFTYKITTDFGCDYDTTLHVGTKLCLTIPNIVSLNSKNGNDKFFINTGDIKNFKLEIFNRWGNVVFSTIDLKQPWDGKTESGKLVEEGNYFYIVNLEYNNGEKFTKNGTFLLKY